MRTHREIIQQAGAEQVATVTGAPITTVRSWVGRNSIPSRQWKALIEADIAHGDELIEAASAA